MQLLLFNKVYKVEILTNKLRFLEKKYEITQQAGVNILRDKIRKYLTFTEKFSYSCHLN